ncbi:MAG: hypothetical protein M3203_10930 [Actinomycetota bacterium]|nr:hypothetical protein [Actinomycetota bacterium]
MPLLAFGPPRTSIAFGAAAERVKGRSLRKRFLLRDPVVVLLGTPIVVPSSGTDDGAASFRPRVL